MFTYQEVKETLANTSLEELSQSYKLRQEKNIAMEQSCIDSVASELELIRLFLPENLDNGQLLLCAISMAMEVGGPIKEHVLSILSKYGYKTAGELLKTMQFVDRYYSSELDFTTFKTFAHSSLTIKKINLDGDKVAVLFDDYTASILDFILKKEEMDPTSRRCYCHDVTSSVLHENPELVGAYYYIPNFFKGAIEHSILIDEDRKMVYDMANNIALPLSIWQRYYSTSSFTIKGKDFKEIADRTFDDFGKIIVTANLEEIKRRRKK